MDRPEEAMRHRHRRGGGKRDHVERRDAHLAVLTQDLALAAAGDDLIEAGAPVALVIHTHIMFSDAHQPRGLVDVAAAGAEMLLHRVARQRLDLGRAGVIAE